MLKVEITQLITPTFETKFGKVESGTNSSRMMIAKIVIGRVDIVIIVS